MKMQMMQILLFLRRLIRLRLRIDTSKVDKTQLYPIGKKMCREGRIFRYIKAKGVKDNARDDSG